MNAALISADSRQVKTPLPSVRRPIMRSQLTHSYLGRIAAAGMAAVLGAAPLHVDAQQQLLVPEGTVFTVRSETELDSRDTQVGDRFMTTMTEAIQLNGYNAIPAGSRIEGTVEIVRPATSRQSGIIGVDFTRLVLPSGNVFGINGKLTSLDPTERRQIDAQGG